jgi:predicted aldo/keto reductase-like oxidoreductase
MSDISRRDFLGRSAAAVGTVAATGLLAGAAEPPRKLKSGADQVTLGKTGIRTSLIGIGTGSHGVRHSSNQVKLGQTGFIKLIRHAYDQGVRYIDTADQYGSHLFVRDAIKGLPRDSLFIQTKTHATTPEMLWADLNRFREELGVEYIDSVLMHCMTVATWPRDRRPVMDALDKAKDKKLVRAVGVSCHGMPPLQAATRCDWIDIDLARINPVGVKAVMDGSPEQVVPCLRAMHSKGKGILGMKILGEGRFKTEEEQVKSLRFVLGLGCVDAMVIGFEKPEQIEQIMRRVEMALKS